MRRIVIWIASTVTVVVLLLGYHTSTSPSADAAGSSSAAPPPTGTSSGSSSGSGSGSGSSTSSDSSKSSGSSKSSKSSTSGSSTSSAAKDVTGSVASTRYGPVQVRITVKGSKVTAVDVLQSPDGSRHDVELANRALPVLVQETLDAQSAKIDMVSGATYTSDGYVTSLQSALDQAGI